MTDDNRVRVNVGASSVEEHERNIDVRADIGVSMSNQATPSATIGIVLMVLGGIGLLIGSVMYLIGYPDRWYGTGGVTVEESKQWVESIVLLVGLGIILAVYGTSLYYFGRHVAGRGRLQHFRLGETMEMNENV